MKKIFILMVFMAVLGLIAPGHCVSVMEPQWAEFCPPLYENAVFKKSAENSKRYMENNYWALRRVKFEKSVAECKAVARNQDELNNCFARVANIERNKTAQRKNARYEKFEDEDRAIRDGWWY